MISKSALLSDFNYITLTVSKNLFFLNKGRMQCKPFKLRFLLHSILGSKHYVNLFSLSSSTGNLTLYKAALILTNLYSAQAESPSHDPKSTLSLHPPCLVIWWSLFKPEIDAKQIIKTKLMVKIFVKFTETGFMDE